MDKRVSRRISLIPMLLAGACPTAALAGQAAPSDTAAAATAEAVTPTEIVVTSRKRAERLQEVPLSVSVTTGAQLYDNGAVNLESITSMTPGVQFNDNLSGVRPGRQFSDIRFRGISGSEFSTLSTASAFIDGIYVEQGAQSIQLMDLDRVEIVKGPQAAQFGRNSFAGAINYVTHDPSMTDFHIVTDASVDSRGGHELDASIEGPIIRDKLSIELTARDYRKGSQFTASDGGALGEEGSRAISATIVVKPIDGLKIKGRVFYQSDNDGQPAVTLMSGKTYDTCSGKSYQGLNANGNAATIFPTHFYCGEVPAQGSAGVPPIDMTTAISPAVRAALIDHPQLAGVPTMDHFGLKRDMLRLSLATTYEFGNGMSLDLTAAHNTVKENSLNDADMTTVQAWYTSNPQKGHDTTVDLRLNSKPGGRLRWMIGGSYYSQNYVTSGSGGVFYSVCLNIACNLGSAAFPLALDSTDIAKEYGGYGTLSYDIFRKLTVDFEARYQNDSHSDGTTSKAYNQFLPRVTLSYRPSRDVMLYTNYSIGRLSGVINTQINNCSNETYTTPFTDPRTGQPSYASVCDQLKSVLGSNTALFTPEQKLTAYEVGVKTSWFNNRLTANLAGYWQKWANQPYTGADIVVYEPSALAGVPNSTINLISPTLEGDSKYWGVEFESTFKATSHLDLMLNAAYTHARLTHLFGDSLVQGITGTPNVSGNTVPRYPARMGAFTANYHAAINAEWAWFARTEVIYQGQTWTGNENLAFISGYALVNGGIGLQKGDFRIEVFGRNILNQKRWAAAQTYNDLTTPGDFNFGSEGAITLVPQERPTFGIRTRMRF